MPEKNRPWSTKCCPGRTRAPTARTGSGPGDQADGEDDGGRGAGWAGPGAGASSEISGGGPSSACLLAGLAVMAGQARPSAQPIDAGGERPRRERDSEKGQGEEGGDREHDQAGWVRARRPTRTTAWMTMAITAGARPSEQAGEQRGVAEADVERRQAEQGQHAGQHEQGAGDQAAAEPVEQPADVDGQLLSLGAGEQHAVVEGVQESALPDPAFLVDQGALHDRDLPGRSAEGLQARSEPRLDGLPERDHVTSGRHFAGGLWAACSDACSDTGSVAASVTGGVRCVVCGSGHAGSVPAQQRRGGSRRRGRRRRLRRCGGPRGRRRSWTGRGG